MKYTTPIALLAVSAQAYVVEIRDVATIKGVLLNVQNGVDNLDAVGKAFDGNIQPVLDASNALITTVNEGKSTVDGSSNLSLGEALQLLGPVGTLKDHAQTLSDDLLARRAQVQQAKGCDLTRTQIGGIKDSSKGLIASIVSKVPDAAKNIANQQASQFTDILQKAEDNFAGSNCVDA